MTRKNGSQIILVINRVQIKHVLSLYFLEKAFIWTEWGSCHVETCIQRRKRKCKDESKCKGSANDAHDVEHLEKDSDDWVEAGWEKFDRGCTDVTECFADVSDNMPVEGKKISNKNSINNFQNNCRLKIQKFYSELKFCDFNNKRIQEVTEVVTEDDRIIGGVDVKNTVVMPWVVRLEFTAEDGTKNRCAGTVVHKKFVLTTTQCCKVSLNHMRNIDYTIHRLYNT